MRAFFKKHTNLRIVERGFISFFIATLFVLIMDFDLLKALFELYYGDSEISQFFADIGKNVYENSTRSATLLVVIYNSFYSVLPIAIMLFFMFYYHSKSLPKKWLNSDFFRKNDTMGTILHLCRYALGFGCSFLILNFGRDFLSSVFHNCLMGYAPDFLRIIIACMVFMLFTINWVNLICDVKTFPKRHPRLTIFLFILFISIISCCLLEFQVGSKMLVFSYLIHINIMYWLILQLILFVLFRKPKIGAIISMLVAYLIGLANDVVCQFRGNYIMFGDLTVVRTAMEVAGNYDYKPKFWFWLSLGLLLVMIAFVIFIKLPKRPYISEFSFDDKPSGEGAKAKSKEKPENELDGEVKEEASNTKVTGKKKRIIKRIVTTVVFEGLIVTFVIITMRTGDFYGKVFGVGWNYNDNVTKVGYLPYFISNMDSTRKIVLNGYSASKTEQIFEGFINSDSKKNNANQKNDEVKNPNIIIIQNEAFSDYSITADIETDQDFMPYIHSMKENTQKGYLNMSITGGPTANTEFEVLSRSSMLYFPYGSVPYTQYIKQNIPSLVETLKNQDNPYYTVAYHSYYSSGYNRNSVYNYMGFDRKEFENNYLKEYDSSDLPRDYMSDEANYRKIIQFYEDNRGSGKPFFCFNVTMQGHGGYTGGPFDLSENVKVTNFKPTNSINTYLSCVKMSDTAFKGLIDYYKDIDEPTIIFMYGDHQPAFDDGAVEVLDQHPAWDDDFYQSISSYYVPYVMWANFDIEEYDHLKPWGVKVQDCLDNPDNSSWDVTYMNELSTNYIGSYVLNAAGVELSTYDKMLLDIKEEIPAFTAIGIWDNDDNYYSTVNEFPDPDKLKDLAFVQYNMIFDKKNKLTQYFLPE